MRTARQTALAVLATAGAALAMAGCATTAAAPAAPMPVWELANAEPVHAQRILRARVSFDRPLPANVTQKLCDEFSIITIESTGDWAEVRRRLRCEEPPEPLDFSSGMVVGILAHVGEASGREWPVKITAVRTRSGVGWLEAAFTPGLYYPLKTAGYLEFAYVPGLRSVCMIRVGHRTFIIRSPMPVY